MDVSVTLIAALGSAVPKTVEAPVERMKLLLQNQKELIKQGRLDRPYKGLVDCWRRTVSEQGNLSLWRGNFANILLQIPTIALTSTFHHLFRRMSPVNEQPSFTRTTTNFLLGGLAGWSALSIAYPLDYAHTRLASDTTHIKGEKQFNGLLDLFKKTLATDGTQGLYRGFMIRSFATFMKSGLYFNLVEPTNSPSNSSSFFLSWMAINVALYPVDTISRRMMMTSGIPEKYNGSLDAFKRIVAAEGVSALYKGGMVQFLILPVFSLIIIPPLFAASMMGPMILLKNV